MSDSIEQRKLAAIMFTDMVGYSALAQRNHDVTAERRIELKIGIHIGDVVHRGGDVYGDGVNIASRIEPLAGAGGICVSMDVERQIRNALEARFEKLAPTELKNISVAMDLFRIVLPWEQRAKAEPAKTSVSVRLFPSSHLVWVGAIVLAVVGSGWWLVQQSLRTKNTLTPRQSEAATNLVSQKSIAVLPFENLSRDPDNAYFADGIQDEILARLSKIADMKVISRTSTQKYKSAPNNLREIAKQRAAELDPLSP